MPGTFFGHTLPEGGTALNISQSRTAGTASTTVSTLVGQTTSSFQLPVTGGTDGAETVERETKAVKVGITLYVAQIT